MADAQITLNELSIIETNSDPTVSPGISSPIGSIAILDGSARKWQKFGPLDTDWKEDNVAANTWFNNATNGFIATEVQAAIEEARQGTGDTSRNFSYNNVKINESITIPDGQQMRVYQELRVSGDLNIYGEAIVKDV